MKYFGRGKGLFKMVLDTSMANRPIKKGSRSRRVCLLVIILMIFFAIHFFRSYAILQERRAQLLQVEEEIKSAETENERLITLCDDLDSQQYIEKIAREDLGMVKKGEILIIPVE